MNSKPERSSRRVIDRRTMSEPQKVGITFAAVGISWGSKAGHAYVLWEREDSNSRMSISEAVGFYPKSNLIFDVIFGGAGQLRPDSNRTSERQLTVLVDSAVYKKALKVRDNWNSNGWYEIGQSDCVDHVGDIAKSVGLKVPDTSWIQPIYFIEDLDKIN